MPRKVLTNDALLELQKTTFQFFLKDHPNGLIADNSRKDANCSIAAIGLALSSFCVAVENGFMKRSVAREKILNILKFFWNGAQSKDATSIGYKGFFYHFIDMTTGKRAEQSELSTIDTAFFVAGSLAVAEYFNKKTAAEKLIRKLGHAIYKRVNWKWMLNGQDTFSMGWKPESEFLKARWQGYNEGLILYVLALASPTYSIPRRCYSAWTETYKWKKIYNIEFLYAGSLSLHHLSHLWIDFREIQDKYMRAKGINYFENTRRATYIQQQYAIHNPKNFKGYEKNCWGLTASQGPGPKSQMINKKEIKFYNYKARQIPQGPDDGTLSARAGISSLPFTPEIVLPLITHFKKNYPRMTGMFGFKSSFNPTFRTPNKKIWIASDYYALGQGSIVLMIENYRTGFFWKLMRQCKFLTLGLKKAGFKGGWL